jgi:hypothetical protein
MRRVLTCLLAVVGLVAVHGAAKADPIGFAGPYAPANWTTTNTPAGTGGTADFSGAPGTAVFSSGDVGVGGNTDTTLTAPSGGTVSFDWSYSSTDFGTFDTFGYLLNGNYTQLVDNDGNPSGFSGSASFNVNAGDTFGFRSTTADGGFGPGIATVTNFDAPGVPEPASMAIFGGLVVAGIAGFRRRMKKA